jgi:hypothetical protein
MRRSIKPSTQVARALRQKVFVRFTRPIEPGNVYGYVYGSGPKWFLVAIVVDASRFNGFQCFRLADVRDLRVPAPYAAFLENALRMRRIPRPKKPSVNLATIEKLLVSAGRAFPLVTIHREQADPEVCHIGRVLGVGKGRVSLLEICPDATWEKEPQHFRLGEITRVNFAGEYEASLHLVGSDPPKV